MSDYLSTAEAAKRMNLSHSTVCKWCREGKLPGAFQEHTRGPWRIPVHAITRYINQDVAQPASKSEAVEPNESMNPTMIDTSLDYPLDTRRNAQLATRSLDPTPFSLKWLLTLPTRTFAYLINGLVPTQQVQAYTPSDEAVNLDAELALAYYKRAESRYEQDDYDGALSDYSQAINLDPQLTAAYIHRGNVHYEQGNLDEARADYNKAIEIDPNVALAYCNLGNISSEQNEHDNALADYQQALEIDPHLVLIYWGRGVLHWKMGNLKAALADFYRYLQLYPQADNRDMFEEWIAQLEEALLQQ